MPLLRVVPTVPMRLSRLVAIVAAVALTIVIYQSLASQAALASSAAWLTSASKSLGGNVVHAYVYGSAGSPEDGWFPEAAAAFENSPPPPEPVAIEQPTVAAAAEPPSWMTSRSNLVFNAPARAGLSRVVPRGTTLHFTFGSIVMLDFVHNWMHFVKKAGLSPALIGAADLSLQQKCTEEGLPAVGVSPQLDVWSYARKAKDRAKDQVFDLKSDWKYYRHHKKSFLEMGEQSDSNASHGRRLPLMAAPPPHRKERTR